LIIHQISIVSIIWIVQCLQYEIYQINCYSSPPPVVETNRRGRDHVNAVEKYNEERDLHNTLRGEYEALRLEKEHLAQQLEISKKEGEGNTYLVIFEE
jgi:hypothetical protein